MPRPILDENRIHPAARELVARWHEPTLAEVQRALADHAVVVIGMRTNPFVKKARRLLDAAGVRHHYLGYGGYLSEWRKRGAIKMWCGWPTLPMVFVKGQLIGGAAELQRLAGSGELKRMLG